MMITMAGGNQVSQVDKIGANKWMVLQWKGRTGSILKAHQYEHASKHGGMAIGEPDG
jgi:hypothetical protein